MNKNPVKEIGNLAIRKNGKLIPIKKLSNKNKIRLIGQILLERDRFIQAYQDLKLKTEWNG